MAKKETVLSVTKEIKDILKNRLPVPTGKMPQKQLNTTHFIRNLDGTVTDKQLNLIWYPTFSKKMTWEEAKKECEKIGCRLPTTHELFSLVEINEYDPAIDKEIFPDTKTDDWYWTQDSCPWSAVGARGVDFYNGDVGNCFKGISNYVRPVRSSQ
jgi:hypothetical protein